jgi:signal transduction histidine kinase
LCLLGTEVRSRLCQTTFESDSYWDGERFVHTVPATAVVCVRSDDVIRPSFKESAVYANGAPIYARSVGLPSPPDAESPRIIAIGSWGSRIEDGYIHWFAVGSEAEVDRLTRRFFGGGDAIELELRNPLAAIRSATDAMRLMQMPDPRAGRLVQSLDRQTTAMTRMLEDLQDAARTALGKVSVRLERVALPELLADVLNEQQTRTQQAGLNVIAQFAGEVCFVKADRVRLRQILDNLLANAIKFTPAGGTVELSLAQKAGHAVVTVRDSGVGFDEKFADKLFDPFTQAEQGPDRPSGGLGLGLAIASRLAKLQGASLSAASGN